MLREVTNPDRARLSVATFHDPAKTVKTFLVSELINDSSPAEKKILMQLLLNLELVFFLSVDCNSKFKLENRK